jgi:TRAP-type uncharacterized transport system fused permease subunit
METVALIFVFAVLPELIMFGREEWRSVARLMVGIVVCVILAGPVISGYRSVMHWADGDRTAQR